MKEMQSERNASIESSHHPSLVEELIVVAIHQDQTTR